MEKIKGRELFRVPEPAQIVLFCLVGLLVAVLIWSVVMPKEQLVRYARMISGKKLVFHAMSSDCRQEFTLPTLTYLDGGEVTK